MGRDWPLMPTIRESVRQMNTSAFVGTDPNARPISSGLHVHWQLVQAGCHPTVMDRASSMSAVW
jgi:hypothetical protein